MASLAVPLQPSPESSKLFFVLSGEHASLPAAEVQAILDSSGASCSEVLQSYRLLTLQASSEVLKQISDRSLMYDWCGVELGRCEADESEIRKLVKSLPLEGVAKNASSYAVRSMRLGGVTKSIPRTKLERDVGGIVKDEVPRLRVKLRGPDLTFACVLFDDLFLFGAEGFWKASGLIAPEAKEAARVSSFDYAAQDCPLHGQLSPCKSWRNIRRPIFRCWRNNDRGGGDRLRNRSG